MVEIDATRVVYQTMDEETLIIDLEAGSYYSTRFLGSEIWELALAQQTIAEIVQQLSVRHHLDPAVLEGEVHRFLDELRAAGLLSFDVPLPLPPAENGSETELPFEPPTLTAYTDMQDLLLLDPIHEVGDDGWPTR